MMVARFLPEQLPELCPCLTLPHGTSTLPPSAETFSRPIVHPRINRIIGRHQENVPNLLS